MKKIFIHVGFPKTGTTFLQKSILSDLHKRELIHYVNYDLKAWRKLSMLSCTADYLLSEEDCDSLRKLLKEGMINVISDESLIGAIWMKFCNFSNNQKNIKKAFPDAKIIFTIRNHVDLLQSLYAQFHHEGGVARFGSLFLKKENYHKQWQILDDLHIPFEAINYSKMISDYEANFGKENILILPFEKLVTNKDDFYQDLLQFIGVETDTEDDWSAESSRTNKSFTWNQIRFSWLVNKLSASRFNKYGIIPNWMRSKIRLFLQRTSINQVSGRKFELDTKEKEEIKKMYSADVMELDQRYNLNLQKDFGTYYL